MIFDGSKATACKFMWACYQHILHLNSFLPRLITRKLTTFSAEVGQTGNKFTIAENVPTWQIFYNTLQRMSFPDRYSTNQGISV